MTDIISRVAELLAKAPPLTPEQVSACARIVALARADGRRAA